MKKLLLLEFIPFVFAIFIFICGLGAFALIAWIISLIAGIQYYSITQNIVFWIMTIISSSYIAYLGGETLNEQYKK